MEKGAVTFENPPFTAPAPGNGPPERRKVEAPTAAAQIAAAAVVALKTQTPKD